MSASRPLAERLRPEALAQLQRNVTGRDLDHRRALTRKYMPSTLDHYRYRMKRYVAWCRATQRQADILLLTDDAAEQYVRHQIDVLKYHPRTIMQSLNALKYEAGRAGVDPVPSMRSAYDLLRTYASEVDRVLREEEARGGDESTE